MQRTTSRFRHLPFALALVIGWMAQASWVDANHSAGSHWPRSTNPLTVQLGNNLTTSQWSAFLADAATKWSQSDVLDVTVVAGQGQGFCQANPGQVEVCNGDFGNSSWLALADVWVDKKGHIVQATIKLNDPRFVPGTYNDFAKQHVLCQAIGRVLGLAHVRDPQSFTCMDEVYGINDPDWASPSAHDFNQLARIYRHQDKATTGATARIVQSGQAGNESISVRDTGSGLTVSSWAVEASVTSQR